MQRRSVDLLEPDESAELTGRISPLDAPCSLSWRESTFGGSSVRLFSADAHRYERTATFGSAHPRRLALMVVGQGRLRGRFGARDVDLERGAALITDTTESVFYESTDRLRVLGIAVDAAVLGGLSRGPHAARLQRTTLVNSVIAFASAMFADDGDDPAAAGSVEDLDRAVCELQARVLAEASAARPDDDLRTRIDRYIDAHLADQALSPRRIADAFGISVRQTHLVFNRGDETLARAIRERRIDAVADELLHGSRSGTGELLVRYGFGSRDQLARGFRERFGTSVGDFRASVAAGTDPH